MSSPNTTGNVSSFLERTLEGSKIFEIIRGNLSKAAARRNVPPDVRTTPTPSDLRLQLYELGILSRHLLFSNSPDEQWTTRWVAALDKVAQAFATEIPLAQPDSDDNCVNYDRNIDEWIKTVVPEHVRIIRVVLEADNEHQKLLELVQSLQQIHQNLDAIARVFPGGQEVRRRQLRDLMLTLLRSLEEHQTDLEDTVPPGEASQLFALANFAAQSSYDDFSDSSDTSLIDPVFNFLPTVPTTSHSGQLVADHGDEHGTVDMSTTGITARPNLTSNQSAGRGDANDTISMSMTGVMTRSNISVGDASHAIEEAQPPAVPVERRGSDAAPTSSVTSVLQRATESGSLQSSSRRPIEVNAAHRAGHTVWTSTPAQGGRQRENARRMSESSARSWNATSNSPIPFGSASDVIPSFHDQIADAIKEKEKSETEVAGLRAQIQLLKESLENERAERKREVEKEEEERKREVNDLRETINNLKEERKQEVNNLKEERKREANDLREERKRMVADLEFWKALALKRDAQLEARNEEFFQLKRDSRD